MARRTPCRFRHECFATTDVNHTTALLHLEDYLQSFTNKIFFQLTLLETGIVDMVVIALCPRAPACTCRILEGCGQGMQSCLV